MGPEFFKQDFNNQVAYWVGRMCLGIGKNDLHGEIVTMIMAYQQEAYNRGFTAGAKTEQK